MKKKSPIALIALLGIVTLMSCSNDDDLSPASKPLVLDISGLENLGNDYVYEGWVIVDGVAISTGTFTVDDAGAWSASSFDVDASDLDNAAKFVLTLEPAGETGADATTPSDQKLLAGDFNGTTAMVSTATAPALGDFSAVAGTYFLRTPTDEAPGTANNGNDINGVWFGIPGMPPTSGLTMPTLPTGWIYEGWVIGDAGPITTGTFSKDATTDFMIFDDENPFSGVINNVGPPVPGEDFFLNAPSGETFPLDLRGRTIVISVEPVPDNSAAPFLLKPLLAGVSPTALTAPTFHEFAQNLGSLPTGTATR